MQSRTTVLAVVSILGAVVVLVALGAIILVALNKSIPTELWAFGTTALGAVAGLLAKTETPPSVASIHSDVPVEAAPSVG